MLRSFALLTAVNARSPYVVSLSRFPSIAGLALIYTEIHKRPKRSHPRRPRPRKQHRRTPVFVTARLFLEALRVRERIRKETYGRRRRRRKETVQEDAEGCATKDVERRVTARARGATRWGEDKAVRKRRRREARRERV